MKIVLSIVAAFLFGLTLSLPAAAQKGTGQQTGVARQADLPPIETLSGTVSEIDVGRCEMTTGRSAVGAHLMLDTDAQGMVNLHLGPLAAVDHLLEEIEPGQQISVEAFRTDAMPENAYVAKSLTLDDTVVALRDDRLRPGWAMGRGRGQGMGQGPQPARAPGQGQGRGQGTCWWQSAADQ